MKYEKIGFTGTQRGITDYQHRRLIQCLVKIAGKEFHHGDCIGADEAADKCARALGYIRIIHPPINLSRRAWCNGGEMLEPKPYLERNQDIVNATEMLIAAPGEYEEQLRSGTWSTVRKAKKAGKPIVIILPDGSWHLYSKADDIRP